MTNIFSPALHHWLKCLFWSGSGAAEARQEHHFLDAEQFACWFVQIDWAWSAALVEDLAARQAQQCSYWRPAPSFLLKGGFVIKIAASLHCWQVLVCKNSGQSEQSRAHGMPSRVDTCRHSLLQSPQSERISLRFKRGKESQCAN